MKLFLGIMTMTVSLTTIGAVSQPAWSKPAPAANPANSGSGTSSNPVLRGVTFTPEQRAKIGNIQTKMNNKMLALLTPSQKETLRTSGASAVELTATQRTQFKQIIDSANVEIKAVLTPAQIRQIETNIQSIQQSNGQKPNGSR